MSTEGDEHSIDTTGASAEGSPPQDGRTEDVPSRAHNLAFSVISRLSWAERAVSPWVQRALDAGRASRQGGHDAAARRARTALSYGATSRFLRRAQRFVEGSRSWQPELGSLDPQSVDRFSKEVTERYPDRVKHQVTWLPEEEADHNAEFPLAGQAQPQEGRRAMPAPRSAAPRLPPAMGAGMGTRSTQSSGSRPSGHPANVQRDATRRGPPPRPSKPPPTGRLFSHVEELPVAGPEGVPEVGLDELDMLPETPDRTAGEVPGGGAQAGQAPDVAPLSEGPAGEPESTSRASIQRQAVPTPPTARGEADRDAAQQAAASRPTVPARTPRADTLPAVDRRTPPSPERSERGGAPAIEQAAAQRAAARQGEMDHATEENHPERGEETVVPDDVSQGLVSQPEEDQHYPAQRDVPGLQRRAMPPAQAGVQRQVESPPLDQPTSRRQEAIGPSGPSMTRAQGASTPSDQPRATQQAETPAAQPSPVQEDSAVPPTAAARDEAVRRIADDQGRTAEAPPTGGARPGIPAGEEAPELPVSRGALDLPLPVQRRGQGDRGLVPEGPASVGRRAEGAQLQREAPQPTQAPFPADGAASSTQVEMQGPQQAQAGPQGGRQPAPEVVQRSSAEPPSTDEEAMGSSAPREEGRPVQQPSKVGVAAPTPGEPGPPSAGAEDTVPTADRGVSPPHDVPERPPESTGEGTGDRLPLRPAPRAPARRAAGPGEPEAEEPTGTAPETWPGGEGGTGERQRAGRTGTPEPATTRPERLPPVQRAAAEPGLPGQPLPRSQHPDGTPPADGAVGTEEPVTRLLAFERMRRAVELPTSPPADASTSETARRGEMGRGGDMSVEHTDGPLQRRTTGQSRPVADVSPTSAAKIEHAGRAPRSEQPPSRAPRGEPGGGPITEPLASPRPVVQTKSLAETAILPQVRRAPTPAARATERRAHEPPPLAPHVSRPVEDGTAAGSAAAAVTDALAAPAVTLQPTAGPPTQAVVQRQPIEAPAISGPEAEETTTVQRAQGELPAEGQGQDKEKALERLARDVYPLVKRLLAVERERRGGRWG